MNKNIEAEVGEILRIYPRLFFFKNKRSFLRGDEISSV